MHGMKSNLICQCENPWRVLKVIKYFDDHLRFFLQLVRHGEDLKMARVVQRNIIATIEALSVCTPVLELFCKLEEQMDSKQYYSALKTLEQLEHTHLPRISG